MFTDTWQRLKDLAMPPALTEAVDTACKRLDVRTASGRKRVEEELKLQFYFGGREVACLDTAGDRVVIGVGTPLLDNLHEILQDLGTDERGGVSVLTLAPWEEGACPSVWIDEA